MGLTVLAVEILWHLEELRVLIINVVSHKSG